MRILAKPGFSNRHTDPGNYNLYRSLQTFGVSVDEWSVFSVLRGRYDLAHIHWPDNVLKTESWLYAFFKVCMFILSVFWIRDILRRKLVWTAHNIVSHEQNHPKLEALFWSFLMCHLDGVIVHEDAIGQRLLKMRPNAANVLMKSIPLAHFHGSYADDVTRAEARFKFGVDESEVVFVFVGQIRPYKNVDALISAFKEGPSNWRLIIAGNPLNEQMRLDLQNLAVGVDRIDLRLGFIPDDDLQLYYRVADLVVLPFGQITNSGSALLALSFSCPVLLASSPTLLALKEEFGEHYVSFFEGPLKSRDLSRALKCSANTTNDPVELSQRDPSVIATKTLAFYREVINQ